MEPLNRINSISFSENNVTPNYIEYKKPVGVFQYKQINNLNRILCVSLLLFHLWHIYSYRGNIIPEFSRFKLNILGIVSLILNAVLPCFFFIQGWLKSVEIHTSKPLVLRLHFEYLIPAILYLLVQFVYALINNSDFLYETREFSLLISDMFVFNSGFLSTLIYLFTINIFVDPIALIMTPIFYSCDTTAKHLLNNSISNEENQQIVDLEDSNENENQDILKKVDHIEFRSLTYLDILYSSIVIFLYGSFINSFQSLDYIPLFRYQSIFYYFLSIVGLILICMIFKKRPYFVYILILFQLFFRGIILVSHTSGYSRFSVDQFLASHHFLSLMYLFGVIISFIGNKIFSSWQTPVICSVFSILIYYYNADYYRVMVSPILSPTIISLNSNVISLLLSLASVIGITSFSVLMLNIKKTGILSIFGTNTTFLIMSVISVFNSLS